MGKEGLKYTLKPVDKEDVPGLQEHQCSLCGHVWRRRMRRLSPGSRHARTTGGGLEMFYPYRCPRCGRTGW